MSEEPLDLDGESESPGQWLNARDIRQKYAARMADVRKLAEGGRIRTKGGRFSETDVIRELGETPVEDESYASMTVRQAVSMANQAATQMQRLFDMAFTRADKLLERQQIALDSANAHILKLEEERRKDREAIENIRTQDHLRELATKESEERKKIQAEAWNAIQTFGFPLLAKRFGMQPAENHDEAKEESSTNGKVTGLTPEQKGFIADSFLIWVKNLTEEQLEKLRETVDDDQYAMIARIRAMMS